MSSYTLQINNASRSDGSVAIYQKVPELSTDTLEVLTLAWIAKQVAVGRTVTFTWRLEYSFILSLYPEDGPRRAPRGSLSTPADPKNGPNYIRLDYRGPSGYTFGDSGFEPGSRGSLIIETGVRPRRSRAGAAHERMAAGIGMYGFGTHLMEIQPNMRVAFTPRPAYYVVFGEYQPGQVMDTRNLRQSSYESVYTNTFERELTWDGKHWTSVR